MKVKIGDTMYSHIDSPIMIIMSPEEKDHIKNMKGDKFKYAVAEDHHFQNANDFKKWMI